MRDIYTAALATMRAAYKPAQVHEANKVPVSPTTPYAVVSVSSGAPGNARAGQWGSKSYRVVIQCFGKTMGELVAPCEAANAAFLNKSLQVEGWDVGPPHPEEVVSSQPIRDPDGGTLLACTLIYPLHAYPTE